MPILESIVGSKIYGFGSLGILPGFESISTAVTTSGQTSVTFSSIPQTYASLQIRYWYIPTTTNVDVAVRFNSTTSGYFYHWTRGNSSGSPTSGAYTSQDRIEMFRATTNTNYPGIGIIDLQNYTSSTRNKTVFSIGGYNYDNSLGQIYLTSGSVNLTSPITDLTLLAPGNYWTAGATFALYGIKGAA